ncbi:DUF5675 family protein [Mesonia sp. K7]|uniref:DUF5675 family protein n=1 Tax=Mesonia sp. K7 TaxID=2218606 RepID=UPI000DA7EA43|nr:DUF5675 family protein [Mesonia sp. K7]PZD79167.1 hypothetical protein DNG35_03940 [Mesonia sp. K7]
MELILKRHYHPKGCNGALYLGSNRICYTIELPWKDNQRQVSCIPLGRYMLRRRYSARFQWHLQVLEVPNRDLILLHSANDSKLELRGCIAPVRKLTDIGKGEASRRALQQVKALVYPVLERGESVCLNVVQA